LGRASVPADYFTEVTRVDPQLKYGNLLAFNRADMNLVGIIHERLRNRLH